MKKLTHEEFMERFYKKNKNAYNIEILGEYINNRTKIKCKCKKDGHEWEATPNSLLNGSSCPKCSGKIRKTTKYFINELKEINDNIEILGEYKGNKSKIKCKCKKDGHEWEARPNDLLNGSSCPKCSGNAKLTHEEFVNRMKEINDNIEILGKYKNAMTKIKCKCKIDGHEWEVTPNGLLNDKTGCPKCNASKGEKRVGEYLDSKNIKYELEYKFDDCKSKDKLSFDFYIPSLNIVIEYDGKHHYKIIECWGGLDRFIGTKIRDTIKTIYCKENNIKLIRISYWDFDNIEEILEKELRG